MPTYRIELREAKPTNGHTGEPAVSTIVPNLEAPSWAHARAWASRRYGIDPNDPAMLAVEVPVAPMPAELADAPKSRRRKKSR